jgi:hypothetical protein
LSFLFGNSEESEQAENGLLCIVPPTGLGRIGTINREVQRDSA